MDTTCDTMGLARGLEGLDIGHGDAESVETRVRTRRALERLRHDMRPVLMLASRVKRDTDTGDLDRYDEKFMIKAAIIPRTGSEWRAFPNDEEMYGMSASGQHREFLVVLAPDKEQRRRLPGFPHCTKFRFRLPYQFEQIPEDELDGPEITANAWRIIRLNLDAVALNAVDALEREHRRLFLVQNCGRQFQCNDREAHERRQHLEGYEPLSEAFLSQKCLEYLHEALAAELKAFIPLDLSAEERQGHQSLDEARNAIALTAARSIYLDPSECCHGTKDRLEAWISTHNRFTARSDNIQWKDVMWRGKRIQPPQEAHPSLVFFHVTAGEHPRWPVYFERPPVRVKLPDAWLSNHAKAVEKACPRPWLGGADPQKLDRMNNFRSGVGLGGNFAEKARIKLQQMVEDRGIDVLLLDKSGVALVRGYGRSTVREVGGGNEGGLHTRMFLPVEYDCPFLFRLYVRDGTKTTDLASISVSVEAPSLEIEYVNARDSEGQLKLQLLDGVTQASPLRPGVELAGTPDLDSLMGGAVEPYLNSLCVQHYNSYVAFVKFRLHKKYSSARVTDEIRLWHDHGLSAAVDAVVERFTAPSDEKQMEICFVMRAESTWDARFKLLFYHQGY